MTPPGQLLFLLLECLIRKKLGCGGQDEADTDESLQDAIKTAQTSAGFDHLQFAILVWLGWLG